ncbi:cytochrome P450 [Amylostereum chailletii]|nr:cytochrome P450 [Amylostereum chailletii]
MIRIVLTLLAFITAYVAYKAILYPRFFSPLRSFPGPPLPLRSALLGHTPAFVNSEPGLAQLKWARKYGPVVRFAGPLGVEGLVLMKPEALHRVFIADVETYPKPPFMMELLGLVAGYGLFTAHGAEHAQMRKAINPVFSTSNIVAQMEMYFDTTEVLVERMNACLEGRASDGTVLHMYEWVARATLDIVCDTVLGYPYHSLPDPDSELAKVWNDLLPIQSTETLALLSFVLSIPGVSPILKSKFGYKLQHVFKLAAATEPLNIFVNFLHNARRISRQILHAKLKEDAADSETKKDIVSLLLKTRKAAEGSKSGYTMSDEALTEHIQTFIGAGHESSASGLAWLLWLLASHPSIQAELRAHVAPVFATTTSRPTYQQVKDLRMLDNVVMEGLRLFPPVPALLRQATATAVVDGVPIPKGTLLNIPVRAMNMREDIWGADAAAFRPARWTSLSKEATATFGLMTFGAGPRMCIGKEMALAEMRVVLATLVANFEFLPAYKGQTANATAAITMKPKDNMPLLVKPVRR